MISTAVWEHLPDVPQAVREVNRVLRPGGVCRVAVHLFPSLSGGHHLEWQDPEPGSPPRTPAWDHLRDQRVPAHVYLNRLRKRDYAAAFDECLEVQELWTVESGVEWLTPEVEEELRAKGYDRQELLETELVVVARKRRR